VRFALVSNVLPPGDSSHAAIIYRLLRDLDPRRYCVISSGHSETSGAAAAPGRLAGTHYYLPPVPRLTRGYRMGLRLWRERVNFVVGAIARARAIVRILRREECDAVVVCTGGHEVLDFPAAFLASRLAGARFYAYLLDQYGHMVAHVLGEHVFARLEPMLLKRAASVIAPNEFLRDDVRRRHQVDAIVIHNPCDLAEYDGPAAAASLDLTIARDDERRIVYTGAIGPLHYDAFRTLLTAIAALDRRNIRLHVYSAQPPALLERQGIRGPVVFHPPQPLSAMPAIQQRADVLFLPLVLHSNRPELLRTAAPGKIGEYLAACRPILVHAPPDSFLATYFRDHQCGIVVDRSDPAELAVAIDSLLSDPALRARLRARAWERAQADFNLGDARQAFARVIGLESRAVADGRKRASGSE
jgi:glycosyltransferase involved in cell wall biosynthesis